MKETEHVRISELPIWEIHPSPENDRLYRPVNSDDPEILALAESIRKDGVLEPLVITDPAEAYQTLIAERQERSRIAGTSLNLNARKQRAQISTAKRPMLQAIVAVIDSMREHWPLSERMIHYHLLNDPPLRNANRPNSQYRNDRRSYHDMSDLCTRARLTGEIPFEAIGGTKSVA